jgi:hypothetical protein
MIRVSKITGAVHSDTLALLRINAQTDHPDCELLATQIVCFNVEGIFANGNPQTIGDLLLFPKSRKEFHDQLDNEAAIRGAMMLSPVCDRRNYCLDPGLVAPDIVTHEARHSEQWTKSIDPLLFGNSYERERELSQQHCGDPLMCSWFELDANPYRGSYWHAPVLGADGYFHVYPGDPDLDYPEQVLGRGHPDFSVY